MLYYESVQAKYLLTPNQMRTRVETPNGLVRQQVNEQTKENTLRELNSRFNESVDYVRSAVQRNLDKMTPSAREQVLAVLKSEA